MVLADSSCDYSKTQGRNNWFYGYYNGDGKGDGDRAEPSGAYTDDDFEPMEQVLTTWGYEWKGPAQYLKIGRSGVHPEVAGGKSGPASVPIGLVVAVKTDSLVDFAVAPGAPGSNTSYDASGLKARIIEHEE